MAKGFVVVAVAMLLILTAQFAFGLSETPSPINVRDMAGTLVDETQLGESVVLSKVIHNKRDVFQPFVAIIEVRDSAGVTQCLAWQSGMMKPAGQAEIGVSRTLFESGDYNIRGFPVTNITNPQVIDVVSARNFLVLE